MAARSFYTNGDSEPGPGCTVEAAEDSARVAFMVRIAVLSLVVLGAAGLGACGTTNEQRSATGALAGALVGGPVGAAVGGAAGAAAGQAAKPR